MKSSAAGSRATSGCEETTRRLLHLPPHLRPLTPLPGTRGLAAPSPGTALASPCPEVLSAKCPPGSRRWPLQPRLVSPLEGAGLPTSVAPSGAPAAEPQLTGSVPLSASAGPAHCSVSTWLRGP